MKSLEEIGLTGEYETLRQRTTYDKKEGLLYEAIKVIASDSLGIDGSLVGYTTKFMDDLGVSSVKATDMIMELENKFDLVDPNTGEGIPVTDALNILSPADVVAYLEVHQKYLTDNGQPTDYLSKV